MKVTIATKAPMKIERDALNNPFYGDNLMIVFAKFAESRHNILGREKMGNSPSSSQDGAHVQQNKLYIGSSSINRSVCVF